METSVWLPEAVILALVILSDYGPRRFTVSRLVRPFVGALVIIPFFFKGAAGSGNGLLLEIAAVVAGLALGVLAAALMKVYAGPGGAGEVMTQGGVPYVAFWVAVVAARLYFAYGAEHVFTHSLGMWLFNNKISVNGLTAAIIFMSVTMLLGRTGALAFRARRVRSGGSAGSSPAHADQAATPAS